MKQRRKKSLYSTWPRLIDVSSTAERTESPIFYTLWLYILREVLEQYISILVNEANLAPSWGWRNYSGLRYTG